MREYSVNGVMQGGTVRRLQGRPTDDPLPSPGRRRRTGGTMSSRGAGRAPGAGRTPDGGPGRRALPAMLAGLALAVAAIAGLALSGADAAAAGCAAALGHAAPLHDVGKVAIPDAILLKPGPLTPEERAIVETHAEEGHRLVRGSSSSILDMAATIALSHQEKWDGSGYPRGLKGEAIPIEGRIVAVADVFDALTSDRVYRKAFSIEEAVQMMREQRGRHFDPILLDAFMEVLGQTGPDAREQLRSDPTALVEGTLETFAGALERGEAETAEGAIATAIEDGIGATTLHAEVIGPALRRISVLSGAGEIDS